MKDCFNLVKLLNSYILKRDPLVEPIKDFTSLCQDEGGVVTKNCESDLG